MENHVDGTMNMLGGGSSTGRKPLKSGMKELAVFRKVKEQHQRMGKGANHFSLEEPKKLRHLLPGPFANRSCTRSWSISPPWVFWMIGVRWSISTPCTSPNVTSMVCTTMHDVSEQATQGVLVCEPHYQEGK